jgi:hypothetical protein
VHHDLLEGRGLAEASALLLHALIHRSAWKGYSRKSISTILHSLPLWERRMAYFPALELIAKHKTREQ